ncbi:MULTISPECIES: ion transporter [Ramlibacter]|uniref:Ion transporter n=1 Tax=Ramlibacter pinisoli TaxID=2682844 RepID=A0A6N8IPT4_9BURK|nr:MULTISPECIES: ion transporter [Ramlibacter]MBA2963891.1 ion transporter [Ramlibacter sp. CGMCC 1.13660]MVQ28857.1 ion transporter [Ramlibacter pinisoli]
MEERPAPDDPPRQPWRARLYRVIWESDTPAGRLFDQVVVAAILVSVAIVLADSVQGWHQSWRQAFTAAEWFFTLLFTVEYVARVASVERPLRYVLSFFGIVDLLAVLPTYLALFVPELHALIDVRILRLLRIFRIFRLTAYVTEYQVMGNALWATRRKILVFLAAVVMIDLVLGTLMYVVEGPEHGFKDIPTSVYWAITTMTTVGFGDITPRTDLGRTIASLMMLLGWGTLAVPTGIVTAEMTARRHGHAPQASRNCAACGASDHGPQAAYCQHCGAALPPPA